MVGAGLDLAWKAVLFAGKGVIHLRGTIMFDICEASNETINARRCPWLTTICR
jgi:hypothetical protein